jgi:hypothetical protein
MISQFLSYIKSWFTQHPEPEAEAEAEAEPEPEPEPEPDPFKKPHAYKNINSK